MVKIYVDDKEYHIKSSGNLLQACLSIGVDVPFFCWHPALGSVGSCRQCAITVYRDQKDQSGSIIMACMSEIQEGMRISTLNSSTKKFQKSISELMMLNHPHDCPICPEGGCCHLQDMTVLNQHNIRRYRFKKRIFKNQYLGPFVSHTMNRCITCYRCVRYYVDYAGGSDFGVYGSNNKIYFGRLSDGILESEYSGNLIDVCPTGVFTDKTNIQNFHRKWDLQYAPSICPNCSIGCNTSLGSRLGKLCRIDNRYHSSINKYFLCDLGRFGCNHVNFNDITKPFRQKNNRKKFLDYDHVISLIINIIEKSSNKILGIGSSRASVESNAALCHLVGPENFSNGMLSEADECMKIITQIAQNSDIHNPSLVEIETYDVILIIGEDITQTAPLAALSVRQAIRKVNSHAVKGSKIPIWHVNAVKNVIQNQKNPLFIVQTDSTKLDDICNISYCGSIKQQLQFSKLILDGINNYGNSNDQDDDSIFLKIDSIVKQLCHAKKPLIISGASLNNVDIIKVSYNIARALQKKDLPIGLALFPPSTNSMGLSLIPAISCDAMFNVINSNKVDVLIILENDLYRFYESKVLDSIFKKIKTIIVLDHYNHKTIERSDIFLSCTSFSESSGHFVNYEARLQRFFKTHDPNFYNKKMLKLESWRWIYAIYKKIRLFSLIQAFGIDQMTKLCSLWHPIFKHISRVSPSSSFQVLGQKIARSPVRCSGRTALFSDKDVHEPTTPKDPDSMFSFSMEGNQQTENNFSYSPFLWSPKWNSNQSFYKSPKRFLDLNSNDYEGILLLRNYNKKIFKSFSLTNSPEHSQNSLSSFKIIPYYKILGSEEVSHSYFSNIMKINNSYAKVNYLDAAKIFINEGDILQFQVNGITFKFPVQLSNKICLLHIGILFGCKGFPISLFNHVAYNLIKYKE
ncbi:NADH-quinone oxidoreductase subunit NuoG [Buchnera aphidicola]|uniref:NADH-quinone oxidoreductase subunit NuoG n=1 Tax=Buchnera aphidicola TaxID=9 RepID=UPI00094CB18E|nr:NADH-quinone oxidoreductase subunit NuoG [Buchnera aphidicola]